MIQMLVKMSKIYSIARSIGLMILRRYLPNTLGRRMKWYESHMPMQIDETKHFLVRLDGKNFSKFTKPLLKPFDSVFEQAMIKTMNDAVRKFSGVVTGYCHSDEITLIFRKGDHIYNGRTVKLLTIISSYVSVRFMNNFNVELSTACKKDSERYELKIVEKLKEQSKHLMFDARLLCFFTLNQDSEIINHMVWRSNRDCIKNCISTYSRYVLMNNGKNCKILHKKNGHQQIDIMKNHGFDFTNEVPLSLRYGVYAKYSLEPHTKTLPDGSVVNFQRNVLKNKSFCIEKPTVSYINQLIYSKHWFIN